MSVKIKKVKIVPVTSESLDDYVIELVLASLGRCVDVLDGYGAHYEHENNWCKKYIADPKFYLFRVQVGAIGRIRFCRDAVELGIKSDVPLKTLYFTNTALYNIARLGRQVKKQYVYTEKIEKWVNCYLQGKSPNSRFLEDEMYV